MVVTKYVNGKRYEEEDGQYNFTRTIFKNESTIYPEKSLTFDKMSQNSGVISYPTAGTWFHYRFSLDKEWEDTNYYKVFGPDSSLKEDMMEVKAFIRECRKKFNME